jgi:hypothetical protein
VALSAEPIGFVVIAQSEVGLLDTITFTTSRAEAHRIYANAERLDGEVCDALVPDGLEAMRITLANVYDEGEFYKVIAAEAPSLERPDAA